MYLRLIFLSTLTIGCLHKKKTIDYSQAVQEKTILPKNFSTSSKIPKNLYIKIPGNLLSFGKTLRPRTEMRLGPSGKFKILNGLLKKNEFVILLSESGNWLQIYTLNNRRLGWVHKKSITQSTTKKNKIYTLPLRILPTVFTKQNVTLVRDYLSLEEQDVFIQKGSYFKALQQEKQKTLIWIASTNSVVWLNKKNIN